MTAQENRDLVHGGYEAFATGDLDAVAKLFAPDISWHISGRSEIAGTYTGIEEVFGFFGRVFEMTGGTLKVELHDILASEDHVVALVRESATRDGKELASDEAHVWHLSDGFATEYWALPADAYATDAFWS